MTAVPIATLSCLLYNVPSLSPLLSLSFSLPARPAGFQQHYRRVNLGLQQPESGLALHASVDHKYTSVCEYTPTHDATYTHTRYLHSRGHTWTLQTENTLMCTAHRCTDRHMLCTQTVWSTHLVHTHTSLLCTNTVLLHLKLTPSLVRMLPPQLTR